MDTKIHNIKLIHIIKEAIINTDKGSISQGTILITIVLILDTLMNIKIYLAKKNTKIAIDITKIVNIHLEFTEVM